MKCGNVPFLGKPYRNIMILIAAVGILIIFVISKIYFFHPKKQAEEGGNVYKTYTSIEIKPGDSLWSIASEYMTEEYGSVQDYVEEIKSLNRLGSDEIHAGKFLIIPYYVRQ